MQIQIEGVLAHFKTTLIAIEADQYLMIETPKFHGIETKLFSGNQVVVRFVYSGTVYGFMSKILNYIKIPSRLMFLTYPEVIESQELRKECRVECLLPAMIKFPGQEEAYRGVILDISGQGCNLTIVTPLRNSVKVEDKVQLTFQLVGIEGSQTVPGEVRNTNQDSKKISIGIKFVELTAEILNNINSYVRKVLEFQ